VVGKTTADASTILGRARLVLGNQTTQEDESRQPGTIISQDPEFGEFVDENTPVDIVVVGGVGSVIVPDVVGQTPQDADTMLKRSELVLGNVEPRYSDEVAAGRIIEQDVRAGTNHPKGDAVNVAVSRGPALDEGMLDPDGDLPADEPPGGDLPEDDEASAESQTPPIIAVEPADGRANVRVALGRGQGPRRIRIVKTDEEVRGMAVLDRLVHPGTGLNEWIDVKGRGTIEIYVDGELLRPSYDVGTPSAAPPPVVPEGRETP
jgi:serine/threonine-protein kinase